MISVSLDVGSSSKSRPQNEQAQRPKPQNCLGGPSGEEMDVGGPGCAPGLPSDYPGDALIEAIIGGIPQKMQNR